MVAITRRVGAEGVHFDNLLPVDLALNLIELVVIHLSQDEHDHMHPLLQTFLALLLALPVSVTLALAIVAVAESPTGRSSLRPMIFLAMTDSVLFLRLHCTALVLAARLWDLAAATGGMVGLSQCSMREGRARCGSHLPCRHLLRLRKGFAVETCSESWCS